MKKFTPRANNQLRKIETHIEELGYVALFAGSPNRVQRSKYGRKALFVIEVIGEAAMFEAQAQVAQISPDAEIETMKVPNHTNLYAVIAS